MSKIISVKFYQGVRVGSETLTSFTPDRLLSDATLRKGRDAEVTEHGVLIKHESMLVLVPFNNVAYVQYEIEQAPKKPK
jgi:hypothetical protein